ncbi:hypothetical protein BWI93_25135 [Siphonobacter sp. BAB-5385]|uniref:winged helix-turn-helix domain-containing protein n=1 Tax=Siphonobacter sp. BAB-5385 TaxID=1864822 RepID=UPI000B9E7A76|nr:winged helix-turn-helix domain-containing protein [Siphonobacter sp. BAB-5385]OZI05512.1 hypothetical protein BWI93_25135 [Siphonobacter sp. BAB-5385]
MTTERFILNGKYLVDPTRHVVKDLTQEEEVRLETRVMTLLCILAEHADQLVTREMLVKTIWNDYGGADEALTQSVSHLRKVLQDTSRTIIETIPKKGYVLHASVAAPANPSGSLPIPRRANQLNKSGLLYTLTIALVSGVACWFFFNRSTDRRLVSHSTAVPFWKVNQSVDETNLNTITTVAPDRTRYKLIVHGDSRPAFYINDRLLTPDEMEPHLNLIWQLAAVLQQRQKESADESN